MKKIIHELLERAGITVNGPNSWDIQVHDDRFYGRVAADHSLGLGESYIDGWWDCDQLDKFIARILQDDLPQYLRHNPKDLLLLVMHRMFNFQTKKKAKEVAHKHYNIGNTLYQYMLGPTMNYSCAYWKRAENLDEAQRDKMELICRKLMLRPGLRLLDVGCGWGSLAKYAAENYGVEVVGVTISEPQKQFAAERCRDFPVKILLQDYRDLPKEKYDRIVSVGMFEHVGYKNYRQFMEIVQERLEDDGAFLLQTIGSNASHLYGDPWINKYIFPNGMLPSVVQIGNAIDTLLIMEDWHNFGVDYEKTLLAWHRNFNTHWPELKSQYDERFYRMWNYYLLSCAAMFRVRKIQLWHIVLSRNGIRGGFQVRELMDKSPSFETICRT